MSIRTRLVLQFLLLSSLILGCAFVVVYTLSADYRHEEFISRLKDRGANTAKLFIQVAEVDEALLEKMEQDNPVRLPEEVIRIYDHHNNELLRLGTAPVKAPTVDELNTVRLDEENEQDIGEREQVSFLFNDRFDRFVVIVSGRDIYGRRKLLNQGRVMLATFLIGVGLIFLVGRFYAQRALAPVQRLIGEVRGIGAADLARRVQADNAKDELAQLARSFNELLDRLQMAFLSQKNFIANASHEMRTPLTAISGQLEVLLLRDRDTAEYRTALRSVLEDMHALNRLADRLLLMAQVENKAPQSSFTPLRLDEVLWQARTEVVRAHPGHLVDITLSEVEDEHELMVNGNENLLRSLFSNLMENACKYSADHRASVNLNTGAELVVEVSDNGIGIDPQEQGRIFEPFYRTTNTGGAKGHGIGLSLAQRIAELHHGRIQVRSALGQGACFTVRLPNVA